MPVVAVDHIREEAVQMHQALQNCLGEKGHPFAVISISIGRIPEEIEFIVHKVILNLPQL